MNKQDRAPAPGNNRGPQRKAQQQQQPKRKRTQAKKSQVQVRSPSIPAAYVPARRFGQPITRSTGKSFRVIHSEFFHDVMGHLTGSFLQHVISPSTKGVFPWLSGMAPLWETYRFNYLRFRYSNTVGTTTGGTVALAMDYDSNDPFPATKSELLTYEDVAHCSPYESCVSVCSPHNLAKRTTLYTGATPLGKDPNLYNVGNLYLFTGGNPATTQIGELYVEYDVTFTTPQALRNVEPLDGYGGSFFGIGTTAPFGTVGTNTNLISLGVMSMPVTTGTGSSQTTFTFLKRWKGWATVNFSGTGLTSISEAGTCQHLSSFTEIGFSTQISSTQQILAEPGETYIITIGNTTLEGCIAIFGSGPNSFTG